MKKKSNRWTAHGGISISREPRSRDYFERESRERKQDLAYARPSVRILPRKGRRRIFDLESRWKSTSLGVRPHGNWEHDRVSRIYFVSSHKARKDTGTGTPAYPEDVPLSDLQCDWVESGESRSLANSCEILRTRKTCLTVSFTGIHAAKFKS